MNTLLLSELEKVKYRPSKLHFWHLCVYRIYIYVYKCMCFLEFVSYINALVLLSDAAFFCFCLHRQVRIHISFASHAPDTFPSRGWVKMDRVRTVS